MPINVTADMVSAYVETYREFSAADRPTAAFLERLMEVLSPMIGEQQTRHMARDYAMDDQLAMALVEGD